MSIKRRTERERGFAGSLLGRAAIEGRKASRREEMGNLFLSLSRALYYVIIVRANEIERNWKLCTV